MRCLARCPDNAPDACLPVWKQIHVLNMVGQSSGHRAFLEPHRDDKRFLEWAPACAVKRIPEFALKLARFRDRTRREAGHESIGHIDGSLNGTRPVLARKKLIFVEPR